MFISCSYGDQYARHALRFLQRVCNTRSCSDWGRVDALYWRIRESIFCCDHAASNDIGTQLTILSYVVKKTWLVDIVGSVDQLTLAELLTISSLFIAFIAWLFIAKTDIGIVDICGIIRFVKEMRAKDIRGIMHCMDRDNSFRWSHHNHRRYCILPINSLPSSAILCAKANAN